MLLASQALATGALLHISIGIGTKTTIAFPLLPAYAARTYNSLFSRFHFITHMARKLDYLVWIVIGMRAVPSTEFACITDAVNLTDATLYPFFICTFLAVCICTASNTAYMHVEEIGHRFGSGSLFAFRAFSKFKAAEPVGSIANRRSVTIFLFRHCYFFFF